MHITHTRRLCVLSFVFSTAETQIEDLGFERRALIKIKVYRLHHMIILYIYRIKLYYIIYIFFLRDKILKEDSERRKKQTIMPGAYVSLVI